MKPLHCPYSHQLTCSWDCGESGRGVLGKVYASGLWGPRSHGSLKHHSLATVIARNSTEVAEWELAQCLELSEGQNLQ